MASSGNFMTWSSLWSCDSSYPPSSNVFSGGNCRYSSSNSNNGFGATHSFLSGKWYWEVYIVANGNKQLVLGLVTPETKNVASQLWNTVGVYGVASGSGVGYKLIENSPGFVEIDGFDDVANGDIVQLAFDRDNYKLWVGRNNTWLESGDPAGDSNPLISGSDFASQGGAVMPIIGQGSSSTFTMVLNAGQDDTFGGEITAAGNADGNGFGVFKYAPPSGFLAVCSANLGISSDIDPAQTDSNYGATQFGTVSYTGTGSSNAITGLGFQPDLVWIKRADDTAGWKVTDSTRGVTKVLQPVGNNTEETDSNGLTSFDSDGFTVGSDSSYNASSSKILAYAWRANGGTTSSNIDGSITTTIQTSDSGGFSIIKYTGTGSNATIGHGLSKAPDFMIFKCTTTTDNWIVYHREFGAGNRAQLNNAGIGWGSSSTSFQSTDPDNSVITIGTSSGTNSSSGTMICYAWASIDGYSNFSSYTGTGSTDGAFCFTSFLPKMTWFKRNGSGDWIVNTYDENSVDTSYINPAHNPLDNRMLITSSVRATGKPVDFLSNGYKIRHTDSDSNLTGVKYPIIAWGSVPFKYNNTF